MIKDLTGQKFGKLTVLGPTDERSNSNEVLWKCVCDCGDNIILVATHSLKQGYKKSCGCLLQKDLTGHTFDKLFVIKKSDVKINKKNSWQCVCCCGNIVYKTTEQLCHRIYNSCDVCTNFKYKKTKENSNFIKTPEYQCWRGMRQRCLNKNSHNYKNYGGRGITICDRWKENFLNFLNDVGQKPDSKYSLDRIDVNGNYSPENCRWATPEEQGQNKRRIFLKKEDILYIRNEYEKIDYHTQQKDFLIKMSNIFNTSTTNIWKIIKKLTWKNV